MPRTYTTAQHQLADRARQAGWIVRRHDLPGLGPNAHWPYQRARHVEYELQPPESVDPTALMVASDGTATYTYAAWFAGIGWICTTAGFHDGLFEDTVRVVRADGSPVSRRRWRAPDFFAAPEVQ